MFHAGPLGLILSLTLTATCLAGARDVSPALRAQAIELCSGDALRLCPQAMSDEAAAVSCMAEKRQELTRSCRAVYDQVSRVLRQ